MSLPADQSGNTSPHGNGIGGERKVISVLFTDVVNYTSITKNLDLESVREIINDHFNLLIEAASRYNGTVDQLLGDGMVVFFGAPVAHEDHAQRACYAALAMQEAIRHYTEIVQKQHGIDFQIRIGINSGPVLVGPVGSDQHKEYLAIGDTVNLASRMENASRPGGILVSENTHSLAKDFFRFEPVGEIGIRGQEEPVAAYRLIQATKAERRFDAAVARGLTRFVGREQEVETLRQVLSEAANGYGRIVGIAGEPGIGKSRLLLEFRDSLKSEEVCYLEGRCFHYGSAMPFRPLVDIVRAYFDVSEGEPEAHAKERMETKLRGLDESLVGYSPFLHDMLSFEVEDERFARMENQYRRSKLFDGLTRILLKEASNRPVVVAIEDLHWIDKASEEYLTHLIERLAGSRILLALLYRPEYMAPWKNEPGYLEVHLGELSATDSRELLQSVLPDGEPAPDLNELVSGRAGGNPLFVEEFAHSLLDSGAVRREGGRYSLDTLASTVRLPDTVQGIIAARIDRLPEGLKNTLQIASVIGRDFNYAVLEDVTRIPGELRSQLETLEHLELIIRSSETDCLFKHALIQEVAYESLLRGRRRELHETIGRTIERLYPERLDELVEVLAYHYRLSDLQDNALDYLRKSGRKAMSRYAIEASHQYYQQAFEIISERTGNSRSDQLALLDILLEWAEVFYYRGHFRELNELLIRYWDLVESCEDGSRQAMLLGWLGHSLFTAGRIRESYESLRRALPLAEKSGDQKVIAYICTWLVFTCGTGGLIGEGLIYGEKAMAASLGSRDDDYPYVKSLGGMGYLFSANGQTQKALECGQKLIEFGHSHGNLRSLAMGHWTLGFCYANAGDLAKAYDICQDGLRLKPDTIYFVLLRWLFSYICMLSNRFEEGETAMHVVIADCREYGVDAMGWLSSAQLGVVMVSKGQMEKGFQMLRQSHSRLMENEVKQYYVVSQYLLGMLYSQLASPSSVTLSLLLKNLGFIAKHAPFATRRSIAYYSESIKVCRNCGFKAMEGMVLLELGRLYMNRGKRELARQNLSGASRLFLECNATGSLNQAEKLLETLGKET